MESKRKIFPEKGHKRLDSYHHNKGKESKTILPLLIFLVIVFIVAYLIFNNIYFR